MAEHIVPTAIAGSFVRLSRDHAQSLLGELPQTKSITLADGFTKPTAFYVDVTANGQTTRARVCGPFLERSELFLTRECSAPASLEGPKGTVFLADAIFTIGRTLFLSKEVPDDFENVSVFVQAPKAREFVNVVTYRTTSPSVFWVTVEDANSLELEPSTRARVTLT